VTTPGRVDRIRYVNAISNEHRHRIASLSAGHGARRVRVFGSVARGEAGAGSDLDLLIDLEPGRDLLDLVAIKQDIEDLLGCKVDVVTENSLSPYLREQVLSQAVPL
jgi:predicted nucleotidyltransferase